MDAVTFEGHSNNFNMHTIELIQPVKVGNLFGGVIRFQILGVDRKLRLHSKKWDKGESL
jgi:hypothetical protein